MLQMHICLFFSIGVLEMVATVMVVSQNDPPSLDVLIHDIAFRWAAPENKQRGLGSKSEHRWFTRLCALK